MDFTNIAVSVADGGATTLTFTKADGSTVAFLDPAGVAAAVAAAVAAVPAAPAVTDEDTEVDIITTSGATKKFVPAPVVEAPATDVPAQ
jgi:hypothetical protein